MGVTRRDLLRLALGVPLLGRSPRASTSHGFGAESPASGPGSPAFGLESLRKAPGRVIAADGSTVAAVELVRDWNGPLCRPRLVNRGRQAVPIQEVVLFELPLDLPAETALYGEGFQMLSQTGGTLGKPLELGDYTDARHYKLAQPAGSRAMYGLMALAPPGGPRSLLAFTSCRRFIGLFRLGPQTPRTGPEGPPLGMASAIGAGSLSVVVETEGRELRPGQEWELEEVAFLSGADREALLAEAAQRIVHHHPPRARASRRKRARRVAAPPTGWCSWYCFGPRVTAADVLANLDAIAREVAGLKYIQIDDGYQPAMGDWLDTGPAFGGDVRGVLRAIRERGFEPALWVAPFIAEKESRLFQQHPDWFVRDADGRPLASDRVTFGGWRRGPWFALDGTHPEARKHLESVFRTLRQDWGCTYFKLDANFWGAIHGGRFHDPQATRIEAYRRGMEAVLAGAGDAFVLGCNHPIWPSLGLVHGSRSSNDIKRTWARVAGTARQNLSRNWQNGRLWWNDPDAVVLSEPLGEEEVRFHATAIYACGGMLLSGDDLTRLPAARRELLRKLLPPTGRAARFTDDTLRVGTVQGAGGNAVCLLNWDDAPRTLSFRVAGPSRLREVWTGEDLGRREGEVSLTLPPRSGRLVSCTPT